MAFTHSPSCFFYYNIISVLISWPKLFSCNWLWIMQFIRVSVTLFGFSLERFMYFVNITNLGNVTIKAKEKIKKNKWRRSQSALYPLPPPGGMLSPLTGNVFLMCHSRWQSMEPTCRMSSCFSP